MNGIQDKGTPQEADATGLETQAEPTSQTVQAETQPAAGATQPQAEPKNDKQTAQTPTGEKAGEGVAAAGAAAEKPGDGDAVVAAAKPDPAAQLVVANQRITDMGSALLAAKAEAKAAALGVKPERLKHAVRMAELAGIDPMADGADGLIGDKLQAVLTDMPELLGSAGTGASGAFRRPDTTPIDPFLKGLKQG